MTTEELLTSIANYERLSLFLNSNALCHLLYRVYGPGYADFKTSVVTTQIDAGGSTTIEYEVPVDKIKIPSSFKFTFEAQRKFDIYWVRDGKVFMDVSNAVDWELTPPYSYEAWLPIKKVYTMKITNNDVAARYITVSGTYYLLDKNLFEAIQKELSKSIKILRLI